jgi:hypothetical protein
LQGSVQSSRSQISYVTGSDMIYYVIIHYEFLLHLHYKACYFQISQFYFYLVNTLTWSEETMYVSFPNRNNRRPNWRKSDIQWSVKITLCLYNSWKWKLEYFLFSTFIPTTYSTLPRKMLLLMCFRNLSLYHIHLYNI